MVFGYSLQGRNLLDWIMIYDSGGLTGMEAQCRHMTT